MKAEYVEVKQDLYGAFVVRGIELANRRGLLAVIIGDTWMSIKSFEAMRLRLLDGHTFDSFVHLRDVSNHPDIFGANAAFVLSMSGNRSRHVPFIRLTPLGQERKEADFRLALKERTTTSGFHRLSGEDFGEIPGSPIVYWLTEKFRKAFHTGQRLDSIASLAVGLQTGDNGRFMRQWWEVAAMRTAYNCTSREEAVTSGARWFPYNKGGEFRKWYGNQEYVVNWENDGTEIRSFGTEDGGRPRSRPQNVESYFSPSVSWSDISSGDAAFRRYGKGFIYSNTGHSGFGSEELLDRVALLMNSAYAKNALRVLAPTLHFDIGYVGLVPVSAALGKLSTEGLAKLVSTAQADWDTSETSWDFDNNPLLEIVSGK